MRPLDVLRSIRTKLGVLVIATNTLAALITWTGLKMHLGPTRTFPLALVVSIVVTLVLARGMTSPLREMTAAARAMAGGDYSRRVRATSRDEVGQLANAFNHMADDLATGDQQRRDLIANVSHELRTPVASLRAQLENIVDGVTPATPATLESALTQTERLSRLVTYLLDLSRIEAGAADLVVTTVDVADFLDSIVDEVEMVEAGKNLVFEVDVTPADLTVPADPDRLAQIFVNLLHNAIRHAPHGSTVRVEASRRGDRILIDVADEGPGIAVADRSRIFERFVHGATPPPTSSAGTSGGTGIGLAIVQWAVALHGGDIEVVDSDLGATFRVSLPAPRLRGLRSAGRDVVA
ncbi:HAMP domain-containing sensor histidine kinase [Sanguibacter sp. A247]|uniref:HAMP domain-containing sensor histidine kinase n=1 Tax=unclassified Sanguibacter TaxID=2645534 RepID=UPI003FD7AAD4